MNLSVPSCCITSPDSRYNPGMSPDAQGLLDEARQLSPNEKDWLTEQLLSQANEKSFSGLEAESRFE